MQVADPDDIFGQFARVTGALSSPSRLKLLDRLCQGEQSVEELAETTGLSISNTSRQLRILAGCGLAAVRRDPPRVFYRVADERVIQLWFALRDLAGDRLAELDRLARELILRRDSLEPMRRDELLARLETGDVVLLDVRPAQEFRAGHIPGAISMPLDEIESSLADLPAGREIVAYCRGPYCVLSAEAVEALRGHGFSAVRLEDGLPEWRAAGLPVHAS